MKNYIANLLGIIAAKEFPASYEIFIKKILENLLVCKEDNMIDTFLRILSNILNECDDRISQITGDVLPVIMDVFKLSTVSLYIFINIFTRITKKIGRSA